MGTAQTAKANDWPTDEETARLQPATATGHGSAPEYANTTPAAQVRLPVALWLLGLLRHNEQRQARYLQRLRRE